jgi:hypothetical protein
MGCDLRGAGSMVRGRRGLKSVLGRMEIFSAFFGSDAMHRRMKLMVLPITRILMARARGRKVGSMACLREYVSSHTLGLE